MFSVDDSDNNVNKKVNNNKNKSKKSLDSFKFLNKKVLFIIGGIILGLGLIYMIFFTSILDRSNYFKDIIYPNTSDSYDKEVNAIPYINLNSDNIEYLNDVILKDSLEILKDNDNIVGYTYYENSNILSVAVQNIVYKDNLSYPSYDYVSYNIDMSSNKVLTDDEMLSMYDVGLDDVNYSIEKKFKLFYEEILEEGYMNENECDYECFLNWRGVENYIDNVNYFVVNDMLYAYRTFEVFSVFGEEKYFTGSDFLFKISKYNY